jgi:hypothetical protein
MWRNWEMLGKDSSPVRRRENREVLKPAVAEVEPEEDEHLNWTKEQLARLEFAMVEEIAEEITNDRTARSLRRNVLEESRDAF